MSSKVASLSMTPKRAQEVRAIFRFLRSKEESLIKKVMFFIATTAVFAGAWGYGIWPVDLINDVIPVFGEVDDWTVVGVLLSVLRLFYKKHRDEPR